MSYLTEAVPASSGGLETFEAPQQLTVAAGSAQTVTAQAGLPPGYEYHLPHSKTIDLIGDEFIKKEALVSMPNVVVVSAAPTSSTAGLASAPQGLVLTSSSASGMPIFQTIPQSALQNISLPPTTMSMVGQTTTLPMGSAHSGLNTVIVSSAQHADINSVLSTAEAQTGGLPLGTQLPQIQQQGTATMHQAGGGAPQTFTVDLSNGVSTQATTDENGGVLLCNLDELSRYIPENFYSDFNLGDTNNLEATTGSQPTAGINTAPKVGGMPIISLSNGTILQAASPMTTLPASISSLLASAGATGTAVSFPSQMSTATQLQTTSGLSAPLMSAGPITIQLPTQPQPVQAVKSVNPTTFIKQVSSQPSILQQHLTPGAPITVNHTQAPSSAVSQLQPIKLTTTGYAYTQNGERIAIHGLPEGLTNPKTGAPIQLQLKSPTGTNLTTMVSPNHHLQHATTTFQQSGQPQTLQLSNLQNLNIDPSKLTVLQELPDVSKVIIQDGSGVSKGLTNDSIISILEDMKSGEDGGGNINGLTSFNYAAPAGMEYATAIPVAVTNLNSKDPQKSIKLKGPPSTIVLPTTGAAAKKGSRNIIFAGNNLPPGAIPIQISGLTPQGAQAATTSMANLMPMSPVKSMPMPINLSTLTPSTSSMPVAARKSRVELVTSPQQGLTQLHLPTSMASNNNLVAAKAGSSLNVVTPNRANNNSANTPKSANSSLNSSKSSPRTGNNKTCNWQFENGEICGKTFSKSYNLVVHMRMHEDVRPFQCALCDQTFRQKAHLQRHETTHGIGNKGPLPAGSLQRTGAVAGRKRRKSRGTVESGSNLQDRLTRVNQQFGKKRSADDDDEDYVPSIGAGNVIKNYGGAKRKYSNSGTAISVTSSIATTNSAGVAGTQMTLADGSSVHTVLNPDGTQTVTEFIELKDGAFMAGDGSSFAIVQEDGTTSQLTPEQAARLTVKVERIDEQGRQILVEDEEAARVLAVAAAQDPNHGAFTVTGEEADILRQVTAATPIALTTSVTDAVNQAVSEAVGEDNTAKDNIVLQTAGAQPVVVENFGEHNPELQKQLLTAMMADEAATTAGSTEAQPVVTTMVTAMVTEPTMTDVLTEGSIPMTKVVVNSEAIPAVTTASADMTAADATAAPSTSPNVQVEAQPVEVATTFAPTSVTEFAATGSN